MLLVKETKHFAFGDTDYKLVMKEKKTDKETDSPSLFHPKRFRWKTCSRKGTLTKSP